jgi:hypothetical protein
MAAAFAPMDRILHPLADTFIELNKIRLAGVSATVEVPLSPFTNGEPGIKRIGIIVRVTATITTDEISSPLSRRGLRP